MAPFCWRDDRNDWLVFADEISIAKRLYERDEFQTELLQNVCSKQAVHDGFLVSANPHQQTRLQRLCRRTTHEVPGRKSFGSLVSDDDTETFAEFQECDQPHSVT
jgi:hypothetical protein